LTPLSVEIWRIRSVLELIERVLQRPEVASKIEWWAGRFYRTVNGVKELVRDDFDSGDLLWDLNVSGRMQRE
jgi:hypothetical protein